MRGRVGSKDGQVELTVPIAGGSHSTATMTPEQAELTAHALLVQAYVARGNTPGVREFRMVKGWVLR